jgi:dTDP-glucose 4,6-dehydratase
MRIIITGGCGFIGSSFVHYISQQGIKYKVIDKLTYAGNQHNLPKGFDLLVKDICNVTAEDLGEYDYIVNFAAESHVDNSIKDGRPFVKSNVEGTFNLLELARKNPNLKKFVQISTDEVYGDMALSNLSGYIEAVEQSQLKPSSYYSSTKAAADMLVESCGRTFGLPYLITRTCNNFGVRQHSEKFLPTVAKSIKGGKSIPVYGNGNQMREWIWVEDNVKAIFDLMLSQDGIWNIGSGDRYTNLGVIDMVSKILNEPVRIEHVADRLGHDKAYALSNDKLIHYYKYKKYITKDLKQYLTEQFSNGN